jgi:Asp/Glu/hydantoin racemase
VREVIETIVAADREGFDALVVNCFDDPGVKEARALIDTPVFGLSEPTFYYACQLGEKLGALVPDMPGQVAFVRNQFEALGIGSRLIANGVRAESKPFRESLAEALHNPQAMIDRLTVQARELVDDGANVIVIACGGLGQFCGLLGAATEEGFTRTQGVEITVKEDSGVTRAYVQQIDEGEVFKVGDRVRIMTVNGNARVAH